MSTGVNCLSSSYSDQCGANDFNEHRPKCGSITAEAQCKASHGCYFAGNKCKYIDPDYCTTATDITSCRKDSNDYCYFTNNTCMACNTGNLTENSTTYNLISMDGKHCFPKNHTCKPYYQEGNHAACRKYCEQLYAHNDTTWKCESQSTSSAKYIFDHAVSDANNATKCQNMGGTIRSFGKAILNYTKIGLPTTYTCLVSGSYDKKGYLTVYKKSGKLVASTNPSCESNFDKVEYNSVGKGESGPLLTGYGLEAKVNTTRLLSYFCTCPPGYKLTIGVNKSDSCAKCPSGQTSTVYDSLQCTDISTLPIDENSTIINESCNIWQQPIKKTTDNTNYFYVCEDCPSGEYYDGTQCKAAPRSWYVKVPSKGQEVSRSSEQFGLLRCENGTTASEGAYDEFLCQNITEPNMKVLEDGSLKESCPGDTFTKEGSVVCQKCPAGQYYDGSACVQCKEGTYRGALDDNTKCKDCPADTWSLAGSSSAQDCRKCQTGKVLSEGKCGTQCKAGTFGTDLCKSCEDGKTSDGTTQCQECNGDTPVASADRTTCTAKCNGGEGKEAVPGTTRAGPVYQCKKCSAGRYSNGSTECKLCAKGQITNSDQSSCNQCPYGHAAGEGSSQCDPCTGKFASSDSSTCVSQCESGYGPKLENGTYLNKTTRDTVSAICVQCPAKTHYNTGNTTSGYFCMACQENAQSKDGKSCECNEGFTDNGKGECISKTSSNAQKSSTPVGGIVAGVVVVLLIIAIVLGVVFGLKARRAKHNSVNIRRNVYDDQPRSSRRQRAVVDDVNEGTRHSQLLI